MEKVVYLLGAGFSAPLGIPVMSNFLEKAKDLYTTDPEKYAHFQDVFGTIKAMSVIKNYYDTDLFNIEEILSILETQSLLQQDGQKTQFEKFIIDVISGYTPPLPSKSQLTNLAQSVFGNIPWALYGAFVAALVGLSLKEDKIRNPPLTYDAIGQKKFEYSVITLNYDLVLEKACEIMNNQLHSGVCLARKLDASSQPLTAYLAKLHGSADGVIIPPTWNKTLSQGEPISTWRLAYKLLRDANHIRILGYSLPTSDSYVRYLLKASAIESFNLKSIDVLCLESDQMATIENRYRSFINFGKFRFRNVSVYEYLRRHLTGYTEVRERLDFDQLESQHAYWFS